jgi:protein-tyrosine phosphatase
LNWLTLDGAVNVRDVGGLATLDDGVIAHRRLVRSDNLQDLSSADVTHLVDVLGLRVVVDLRAPAEVAAEGPAPLATVGQVMHVNHSLLPEVGHRTDALVTRRDRNGARYPDDVACASYLGYLEDRADSVVAALRAIAAAPGAALVHCAAGKDRTGVVVALALTVAGAQREAIIDDYVASGERIELIVDRLRRSTTYASDVDRIPPRQHAPRPETMRAFLGEVDRRYGGVRAWLGDHGMSEADIRRLGAKLRDR